MSRPTSVEPVKEITRILGFFSIGSPTSRPPPVTTFHTPFGSPASSSASASMITDSGVSDAGLMTTVLPVISAAIDFQAGIAIGKFHGVMRPTTPSGRRSVNSRWSATDGSYNSPIGRYASPAA